MRVLHPSAKPPAGLPKVLRLGYSRVQVKELRLVSTYRQRSAYFILAKVSMSLARGTD